jgi:hypothetical protein
MEGPGKRRFWYDIGKYVSAGRGLKRVCELTKHMRASTAAPRPAHFSCWRHPASQDGIQIQSSSNKQPEAGEVDGHRVTDAHQLQISCGATRVVVWRSTDEMSETQKSIFPFLRPASACVILISKTRPFASLLKLRHHRHMQLSLSYCGSWREPVTELSIVGNGCLVRVGIFPAE